MQAFIKYQRFTILWSVVILIMCSINTGSIGESSAFFPGFDKLVHCGFFFLFVTLAANGQIRKNKKISFAQALLICFIGVAFGGIIELLQKFVFTWRDGGWDDLFADFVGAGMATFSILVLNSAIRYVKD